VANPTLNLHHLELFHHVAKAGGITAATRTMGYGIQQPAISAQISQLEMELGVRLFQRRPFKLTPAGRELIEFLSPFFARLPEVANRISGKASKSLRLAAPTTAIREHLPAVIAKIRDRQPDLELSLVDASQKGTFLMLENEEVDLAIAELEGKPPSATRCEVLARLPLVVLLPSGQVWPKGGLPALARRSPLIRPPGDTAVTRLFRKGLTKLSLDWPSSIEVSTIDLVNAYVEHGFGCGLSVHVPGVPFPESLQVVPLNNFPKLVIAALWRGRLHPLAEAVLEELRAISKKLSASL